ncbi:MAG: hypothetical protein HY017_24895 [Betaproteobacteria bacterium]|nr:hypothetical protein [Betaproteobacteria bacterium]
MSAPEPAAFAAPDEGLVAWTHVIYALHALSVVIGATSAAFIVTAFVFGFPSIVAVVLNYVKRSEARGTFLESHFRWQIRTFWFTLLWCAIGGMLFATLIGALLAFPLFVAVGLWVVYRVVRGWVALKDGKAIAIPA